MEKYIYIPILFLYFSLMYYFPIAFTIKMGEGNISNKTKTWSNIQVMEVMERKALLYIPMGELSLFKQLEKGDFYVH